MIRVLLASAPSQRDADAIRNQLEMRGRAGTVRVLALGTGRAIRLLWNGVWTRGRQTDRRTERQAGRQACSPFCKVHSLRPTAAASVIVRPSYDDRHSDAFRLCPPPPRPPPSVCPTTCSLQLFVEERRSLVGWFEVKFLSVAKF